MSTLTKQKRATWRNFYPTNSDVICALDTLEATEAENARLREVAAYLKVVEKERDDFRALLFASEEKLAAVNREPYITTRRRLASMVTLAYKLAKALEAIHANGTEHGGECPHRCSVLAADGYELARSAGVIE